MRIYVASSWRNEYQQEVVRQLRAMGHDVYDFRAGGDGWSESDGEGGFSWKQISFDWQHWTPERYVLALTSPVAQAGFDRDMNALKGCDCCVFVMPCGPSASMEMGWAAGAGRWVAAYIPAMREPDLMVKMAHLVASEWSAVTSWIRAIDVTPVLIPAQIAGHA
jgi:hypothetical protein